MEKDQRSAVTIQIRKVNSGWVKVAFESAAIDVDIVHRGIGEVLITSMLLRPFCSVSGGGVARGAMARMISRGAS